MTDNFRHDTQRFSFQQWLYNKINMVVACCYRFWWSEGISVDLELAFGSGHCVNYFHIPCRKALPSAGYLPPPPFTRNGRRALEKALLAGFLKLYNRNRFPSHLCWIMTLARTMPLLEVQILHNLGYFDEHVSSHYLTCSLLKCLQIKAKNLIKQWFVGPALCLNRSILHVYFPASHYGH